MKHKTNIKNKKWILLNFSNLLVFIFLSTTGILLYATPYNSFISGIHIWLAICFVLVIMFHIKSHAESIITYFKTKTAKWVITSCLIFIVILSTSIYYRLTPLSTVLNFSDKLKRTVTIEEGEYQVIRTKKNINEKKITIDVKAGKYYRDHSVPFFFGLSTTSTPQMAFWLEDMNGNLIKTLYTTRKTSYPAIYSDSSSRSDTIQRPEALPYWIHKKQSVNKKTSIVLDAISGATPHGHYEIQSSFPNSLHRFKLLAEVNRSFDFNNYYTKEKYPDDLVYSGDGYPGQPSVIYAAEINLESNTNVYVMKPIGHGHYSGADGKLYQDMVGIDTALQIIQRIIVEVNEP